MTAAQTVVPLLWVVLWAKHLIPTAGLCGCCHSCYAGEKAEAWEGERSCPWSTVRVVEAGSELREPGSRELGPWPLLCHPSSQELSLGFQIGHRDFDVEKRLRRDLRRTHTLLSDVQLLLGTMEDGKTSVSKEELEKVQSQVGVTGLSELGGEETAAGRGTVVLQMWPWSQP